MAKAYDAPMPPAIDLTGGYTIKLTAIDPLSGDKVAGVTVSDLVMVVEPVGDTTGGDLTFGPFMLVPGPG